MGRILTAFVMLLPILAGCDSHPAPAQYDHAMLRGYFGKSPTEVEDTFGKPSSITHADSPSPPEDATSEEQEEFKQATESMTYIYSTVDGDLAFHFNQNDEVQAITYAGKNVSPPSAPVPNAKANKLRSGTKDINRARTPSTRLMSARLFVPRCETASEPTAAGVDCTGASGFWIEGADGGSGRTHAS